MTITEEIIKYQNNSEKEFEEEKNIRTIVNYICAIILFFLSTVVAAFTFPTRFIYKKLIRINSDSEIIHLTEKNIDSMLEKEKLILIDFWAEWCGPCLFMNSTIEKFAAESNNVKVAKVNADSNRKLVNRFQIKGLPQFILMRNGKEIKRYAGSMTISDLNKFCNENG
mgnify:CR=1 FL=1